VSVRTGRAIAAATAAVWLALAAAAWARTPEEVVAAVRAATARYLDIDNARADGYVQITGMEEHYGYHLAFLPAAARPHPDPLL
jgi:hypothetical protein